VLTVVQQFTCDVCGAQQSVVQKDVPMFAMLTSAVLPDSSWTWVGDRIVCPRHDVMVRVKVPKKEADDTDGIIKFTRPGE
jgi:hypothetical protein